MVHSALVFVAMSTEIDYDKVSFVISSKSREETIIALTGGFKTPSEIAERSEVSISHVSRALSSLRERELVELLVDEDRKKGRLYGLTEMGDVVGEAVANRE